SLCLIAPWLFALSIAMARAETLYAYKPADNPPIALIGESLVPQKPFQDQKTWFDPTSQRLTASLLTSGNQFTSTPSGDDRTFRDSLALDWQSIDFEKCFVFPNCGIGMDIAGSKTEGTAQMPAFVPLLPILAVLSLFVAGLAALAWLERRRSHRKRKR